MIPLASDKNNILNDDLLQIISPCPKVVNPLQNSPSGLFVINEWLYPGQEQKLIAEIMSKPMSSALSAKRLTQHYGKTYTGLHFDDKDALPIDPKSCIGLIVERIEHGLPGIKIQQVLVNRYAADVGIGGHVDRNEPIVFGLSLGADINMIWKNINTGQQYEALIPNRSFYIMSGECSKIWQHSVPIRKTISYPVTGSDGLVTLSKSASKENNYCRWSITFRHFVE